MRDDNGDTSGSSNRQPSCCSSRRTFIKTVAAVGALAPVGGLEGRAPAPPPSPPRLPRVFRDGGLAMIAFPLGGIGTGTVSLGGRGQLRDWEIFNEPEKGYTPNYAFTSIWARVEGREPVTRIVESEIQPPYEGDAGLDWVNAPGLPRLDTAVFHGEYPFARIDFADRDLPVDVSLEAFNPLIPLDAEASGLPVAVLRYRIRNPGHSRVDVSLAYSLDNPMGADGRLNEHRKGERLEGLVMTNPTLEEEHPKRGSVAVVVTPDSGEVTAVPVWGALPWRVPVRTFWEDFSEDGALDPGLHRREPDGIEVPFQVPRFEVGSVCAGRSLAPGEEGTVTFVLAWHFPNRTPEVCGWPAPEGDEKTIIGNFYTTRFADAWEAAEVAASRLAELESSSRAFIRALEQTDLPEEVLEAATSTLSVLRTNTCFRTADGRFHGFEGCRDKGCCFGSCTHVWNYEGALAFFFPALSRSLRELQLGFATDEDGLMDFRYLLPYGKERFGRAAADGQMGTLVKLYLDWRLGGDLDWLRGLWPQAKKALEFAWIPGGWDADRDGVMEGCQHNTYDVEFFGPNPLSGVWYLAALRAGEEMASAVGDDAARRRYRELFERGSAWIDTNLFNGEYYVQQIQGMPAEEIASGLHYSNSVGDPQDPDNQMGEGCLADQVLAQTVAHVADLGYLLHPEQVRASLDAVWRHNWRSPLENHVGLLRTYALNDESGLIICDYTGKRRPNAPFFYSSEVWTGIEYQVAANLLHEGRRREGLEIVRAVRERHDGVRRNPWDEAECGHHYVRSMASWHAVWLLLGFHYHAGEGRVRLHPRLETDPARGFWCLPTGWGTSLYSLGEDSALVRIGVERGALELRTLEVWVDGRGFNDARLRIGVREIEGTVDPQGGFARVEPASPVTLGESETLDVRLA
jgi:uncharacterized protein (DUF608 family)